MNKRRTQEFKNSLEELQSGSNLNARRPYRSMLMNPASGLTIGILPIPSEAPRLSECSSSNRSPTSRSDSACKQWRKKLKTKLWNIKSEVKLILTYSQGIQLFMS